MRSGFLASLVLTVALAGCASAPATRTSASTPDLSRYHAVAVDSVTVVPAVAVHLTDRQVRNHERDLRLTIVNSLPPEARAVTPAPGVVRLSVKVTAIHAANPTLNGISGALLLVPLDRGTIMFEAEFADAPGAEPFARTTERYKASMTDVKDNFRRYRHANSALREWTTDLSKQLAKPTLSAQR